MDPVPNQSEIDAYSADLLMASQEMAEAYPDVKDLARLRRMAELHLEGCPTPFSATLPDEDRRWWLARHRSDEPGRYR